MIFQEIPVGLSVDKVQFTNHGKNYLVCEEGYNVRSELSKIWEDSPWRGLDDNIRRLGVHNGQMKT